MIAASRASWSDMGVSANGEIPYYNRRLLQTQRRVQESSTGCQRFAMIERQLHLLSASRMPTSYPLQLSADEVAAWLNGYVAMWHPAALSEASQPPQASVSYDHDNPMTGYIYCNPRGPHLFQPDDWRDRVLKVSAIAFEAPADRKETQQNLLSLLQE